MRRQLLGTAGGTALPVSLCFFIPPPCRVSVGPLRVFHLGFEGRALPQKAAHFQLKCVSFEVILFTTQKYKLSQKAALDDFKGFFYL